MPSGSSLFACIFDPCLQAVLLNMKFMPDNYYKDQVFEGLDFSVSPFIAGEYESCRFKNCIFLNTSLAGAEFTDCLFEGCNLGNTNLAKTTFNGVRFENCKIQGVFFDDCNEFLFEAIFDGCQISYCSFVGRSLKKQSFKRCKLLEADFTGADLTEAVFENCDLAGTRFENTSLIKTDFRTAVNFSLDPSINKLKKARFSQSGLAGLLEKYELDIQP